MEGSAGQISKAIAYDVPNIIFDAENPLGEVIDPETGEPAVVSVPDQVLPNRGQEEIGLALIQPGNLQASEDSAFRKYGIGYKGAASPSRAGKR